MGNKIKGPFGIVMCKITRISFVIFCFPGIDHVIIPKLSHG